MSNRREFLRGIAAAGGAAGLLSFAEQAQGQTFAGTGIHDWHAHWIGPTVVKLMSERAESPRYIVRGKDVFSMNRGSGDPPANARPQSPAWFDVDLRLRELDRADLLLRIFAAAPPGSEEEGWILGVGPDGSNLLAAAGAPRTPSRG